MRPLGKTDAITDAMRVLTLMYPVDKSGVGAGHNAVTLDATVEDVLSISTAQVLSADSALARGDIIIADSNPNLTLLNIGAQYTHLESDGTDVAWQVNLTMADDAWIGLGGAAGRMTLNSTPATDVLNFSTCDVGVNEVAPGANLHVSAATATDVGLIVQTTDDDTTNNLTEWHDSGGNVLSATTAVGNFAVGLSTAGGKIHTQDSAGTGVSVVHDTYRAVARNRSIYKTARGTVAVPTIVAINDELVDWLFQGYDGANFQSAANFRVVVDAAPGVADMPARFVFLLSPDGSDVPIERMRLGNDGRLGVGATTLTGRITITDDNTTGITQQINSYRASSRNRSIFNTARGTLAVPVTVVDGGELVDWQFYGYDGTNFEQAARMQVFVDGPPGGDPTDMPGRFVFATTPDGSDVAVERLRITQAGLVGINTLATPTAHLQVNSITAATIGQIIRGAPAQAANLVEYQDSTTAIFFESGDGLAGSTTVWNQQGADIDFRVEGVGSANALFVQGSDGKIGIGTGVIPHGGVGAAKFAIEGVDGALTGPHVQYTTAADDYPLVQWLPWTHDNVHLSFDAYFDGAWKSSDAGSSFQITKWQDLLRFRYDVAAAGGAVTWNDGFTMDTNGQITLGALGAGFVRSDAGGVLSSSPLVAGDLPAHDILSAQHGDTLAAAVSRGSIIYGNATPKWDELVIGAASTHLESDGVDVAWQVNITMADGATIGQAAGPLIAFDDTNNYLEITGCAAVINGTAMDPNWATIGGTHRLHVLDGPAAITGQSINNSFTVATYGVVGANAYPILSTVSARGTRAAPTAVQSGDYLGMIGATGYDGTAFETFNILSGGAGFLVTAQENWSNVAQGGLLQFMTCASGAVALAERARLNETSLLMAVPIDVNGIADAIILDADGDTTISAPTDDQIDIEIAGADDFTFTANAFNVLASSGVVMADGTTIGQAAGPLLTFDDTNNYLEITGCKVGIGIAIPAYLLDVAGGDINIDNGQFYRAQRNTASASVDVMGFPAGTDILTIKGGATTGITHQFVDTGANVIMTFNSSSVGIGAGATTPAGKLEVDQDSATGAIPVLLLDQADVSEEMIEFVSTIGVGNAIEAIGGKTLTTTHFIKVTLPGALTRYIPVGTIA